MPVVAPPAAVHTSRLGQWIQHRAGQIGPWVRRFPGLRRRLQWLRAWLPEPRSTPTARFLAVFGQLQRPVFFVQIGANDGAMNDPLKRQIIARGWRGILVEPVPEIFERLRANHPGREGLIFENLAIAEQAGSAPFYSLRPEADPVAAGLPPWYAGLGSFRREVILSHRDQIPDIEARLVRREVPCLRFDALCARHGIEHFDLLQIDTEGYDEQVLRQVDLARYRPRLVIYEHHHLSAADRRAAENRLAAAGYQCLRVHLDTLALRLQGTVPALWRAWDRLGAEVGAAPR
ncbi:MAG TPA: FkbM family methyltransferase [Nevskiaceae bacterium]|nr:FkbM family methyltransferase [Nevskiaceae bacterium]